ncbi:hypothetical protein CJU90_5222 [Yarrowia sp. C11]|nr:hypothetical protein CJU90_5222 [Yarrowia sp. C11]KAG5365022.1 hypothetical protein CKK34_3851 [Yarrowia sp. E02]
MNQNMQRAQTQVQPVTAYGVLSTPNAAHDDSLEDNKEWVLFTPSDAEEESEDDGASVTTQHADHGDGDGDLNDDLADDLLDCYDSSLYHSASTPLNTSSLNFPRHQGDGSFVGEFGNSSSEHSDANDRIHAWRMQHSASVYHELNQSKRTTTGTPERRISSWGIPEDEVLATPKEEAASSGATKLGTYPADVSAILRRPSVPVRRESSRREREREGRRDAPYSPRTLFHRITQRVIRDFIGMNEDILDMLAGETFVDGETGRPTTAAEYTARRAESREEANEAFVNKLTRELYALGYTHSGAALNSLFASIPHDRWNTDIGDFLNYLRQRVWEGEGNGEHISRTRPYTHHSHSHRSSSSAHAESAAGAHAASVSMSLGAGSIRSPLSYNFSSSSAFEELDSVSTASNYWEISSGNGTGSMVGAW